MCLGRGTSPAAILIDMCQSMRNLIVIDVIGVKVAHMNIDMLQLLSQAIKALDKRNFTVCRSSCIRTETF